MAKTTRTVKVVATPAVKKEVEGINDAVVTTAETKEPQKTEETKPVQTNEIFETAAESIDESYKELTAAENVEESLNESEITDHQDSVVEEDYEEQNEPEEQAELAPENESIYSFSVEKLEAYLASEKGQDKIIQETRGGNFVSSKDRVIYVPITLFK